MNTHTQDTSTFTTSPSASVHDDEETDLRLVGPEDTASLQAADTQVIELSMRKELREVARVKSELLESVKKNGTSVKIKITKSGLSNAASYLTRLSHAVELLKQENPALAANLRFKIELQQCRKADASALTDNKEFVSACHELNVQQIKLKSSAPNSNVERTKELIRNGLQLSSSHEVLQAQLIELKRAAEIIQKSGDSSKKIEVHLPTGTFSKEFATSFAKAIGSIQRIAPSAIKLKDRKHVVDTVGNPLRDLFIRTKRAFTLKAPEQKDYNDSVLKKALELAKTTKVGWKQRKNEYICPRILVDSPREETLSTGQRLQLSNLRAENERLNKVIVNRGIETPANHVAIRMFKNIGAIAKRVLG